MATLLRDAGWTDWMRRAPTGSGYGTELSPAYPRRLRRPARLRVRPHRLSAADSLRRLCLDRREFRRARFKIESITD
jgi:hypothetical protein